MTLHQIKTVFAAAIFTLLVGGLLVVPGAAAGELAQTQLTATTVEWTPTAVFERVVLTVSGPSGVFTQEFGAGEAPFWSVFDDAGNFLPDGSYTFELRAVPHLSVADRAALAGEAEEERGLGTRGSFGELAQSGYFQVSGGAVVQQSEEAVVRPTVAERGAEGTPAPGRPGVATRDQVILDDLIVDGSACIGFDCVNGESFGFDTLRLKENNVRIKFQDTSNSSSFPSVDWQLTANDSTNGGANKFSIDDIDAGRTPFTIEASAPSNSLYVDDGGRIGLGTSTPVVQVHTVDGNTPTLRLEQDGSSGFTPQTWDLAGNETNFFIRDVTNGSKLPFRIRPGAPTSAIDVAASGNVGIGTASPAQKLNVKDGQVQVDIDATGGVIISSSVDNVLPRLTLIEPTRTWRFQISNNGSFNFVDAGSGNTPFLAVPGANNGLLAIGTNSGLAASVPDQVQVNGNLSVNGNITATGTITPDYVFEPDYALPTIEEQSAYMLTKKHLPAVGAAQIREDGKHVVNFSTHTFGMLEELEKAHLYISQLNESIKDKDVLISDLAARLAKLEALAGAEQ